MDPGGGFSPTEDGGVVPASQSCSSCYSYPTVHIECRVEGTLSSFSTVCNAVFDGLFPYRINPVKHLKI